MSGDVFSHGNSKESIVFGRVNIKEEIESICGYHGKCKVDRTTNQNSDVCNICIYQGKIDIPKIINEKLNAIHKEKQSS